MKAQKAARAYRISGFHSQEKALSHAGLSALDGRSAQARALKVWKAQVAGDLGDDLSAQERTLLDVAAVDMALLAVADSWLRENAAQVVNRRRRTFVPLVAERLRVAGHLADTLKLLGLKRRARQVPSLRDYLAKEGAPTELPPGEGVSEKKGARVKAAARALLEHAPFSKTHSGAEP